MNEFLLENQPDCKAGRAPVRPLLIALLGFFIASAPAEAKLIKGPQISVDQTAPAQSEQASSNAPRSEGGLGEPTVATRRYEVNLLAPIPVPLLGGMFVLKGDFFKERRVYGGSETAQETFAASDLKNPNDAGLGAVFLPHAAEGMPRFFVLAERYGAMSLKRRERPMAEFALGADFAAQDLPPGLASWLRFSPSDDAESRLLVRMRRFPGFVKWLYYVGHSLETASGWSLEVAYPSHLIVGKSFDGGAWKIYGGGKAISREYPWEDGFRQGWIDGYVATLFGGVRRNVTGPLYASLELGYEYETLDYRGDNGETLATWNTKFRPGARFALEAWIKNP